MAAPGTSTQPQLAAAAPLWNILSRLLAAPFHGRGDRLTGVRDRSIINFRAQDKSFYGCAEGLNQDLIDDSQLGEATGAGRSGRVL